MDEDVAGPGEDCSPFPKTARLSAQELFAHRNLDRTIPPRGGTKDYAPDGSDEQEEKLAGMYSLYRRMLAEERVNKIGNLSTAVWQEDLGLAEVTVDKGKFWHHMGRASEGKKYLYPEEAVFLMEMNAMEVYWNKVPLAIQQAYTMLLGDQVSMEQYQVYAHLSRVGYILMRHQSREHFTWYERQIQLDEYIPLKDRLKEDSSIQVRNWFPPDQQKEEATLLTSDTDKIEEAPSYNRPSLESKEMNVRKLGSSFGASQDAIEEMTVDQSKGDSLSACQTFMKEGGIEESLKDEQMEVDEGNNETNERVDSVKTLCHGYKWDFTNITIPNVGQDCDVHEIPIPGAELLPTGVQVDRVLKITTGEFSLNTKREGKRKSHLEHLSKIVPNMKAEDDPKRVARNWEEYKELCQVRREVDMSSTPVAHLWEGEVTPLVRPSDATDMGTILSKLQVIQNASLEKECSSLPEPDCQLDIAYDVFLPDSHFKKSKPGRPNLRVCIQRFSDPAPDLALIARLNQLSAPVPLLWAVVDNGDISFYSFTEADLPTDYHM